MTDREQDLLGIEDMKYDEAGLIPAVVQDAGNGDVLMEIGRASCRERV